MQRHQLDQFCSFIWRPRPPTLLKADDIAKIKKDLKKYSKQFELKDKSTQSKASKELIEKRRALFNEFASVRNRHKSQFEEMKEARMMLRGGQLYFTFIAFLWCCTSNLSRSFGSTLYFSNKIYSLSATISSVTCA